MSYFKRFAVRTTSLSLLVGALLAGCATPYQSTATEIEIEEPIEIKVTGYGAPTPTFQNISQRRLMSLRASEVDAYRKLGEQIGGVHLSGDTRVSDYISGNDRLRLQLNAFVRGAAITSQDIRTDGTAETSMLLKVHPSTLRQMLGSRQNVNQVSTIPGSAMTEGVAPTTASQ